MESDVDLRQQLADTLRERDRLAEQLEHAEEHERALTEQLHLALEQAQTEAQVRVDDLELLRDYLSMLGQVAEHMSAVKDEAGARDLEASIAELRRRLARAGEK